MDFSKILPSRHVILGLTGDTPEAIVRTLSQPLLDDGVISDLDSFVSAVLKREEVFTTQVAAHVAFPHTHSAQVKEISLVVGVTGAEGLVYAPNTPLKCRLFFLIAVPERAPEEHLELMAHLVQLIMTGQSESLMNATSAEDVIRIITE